jgi:hypothetical protein
VACLKHCDNASRVNCDSFQWLVSVFFSFLGFRFVVKHTYPGVEDEFANNADKPQLKQTDASLMQRTLNSNPDIGHRLVTLILIILNRILAWYMILILLIINAPTPIKRMVHFLDAVMCRLSIGFSLSSSQKQQTQNESQIREAADVEKQRLDADSATDKPEEKRPTATHNPRTGMRTRSPAVDANSGKSLYAKWGGMITALKKSTTKQQKDAFEKYVIDEVYL